MGIIGTLWLILIVLKVCGVIAASWFTVLFWPFLVLVVLTVLGLIFGVAVTGFASFRRV